MRSSFRRPAFECLESRVVLHGDGHPSQVGLAFIPTHHGSVPNFAHPQFAEGRTIHTIADDGDLSSILADHAVAEGDVLVLQGHVTYDLPPEAAFSVHTLAIDGGGSLDFRTDIDTQLTVTNLLILEGGSVTIGTEASPVPAHVTSEVVIADSPINVDVDPEQVGHGFMVFGNLTMHGASLANTFVKLAQDAHAGDSALHLQQSAADWRPGDTIFLPDTRQATSADLDASGRVRVRQWEEVTIATVSPDGMTITTVEPLAYDHAGARNPVTGAQEDFDQDGLFDLMPHAANETRNIVVRSANPIGTRGHFIAFERAEVDLRYVQWDEFGRTTVAPVDSTTLDASGKAAHIGTNQIGRYGMHFHHVKGVANPASGYTVQVLGCSVTDTNRWGIVLHDTSWSNVSKNVVLRADGAGIVTEDGSNAFNTISQNFVGVSAGDGNFNDSITFAPGVVGFHGYGIWLSGVHNSVIDSNVMVNHAAAGMNLNFQAGANGPLVRVPLFPGADVNMDGNYAEYRTGFQMPTSIANNEFYGMLFGFESWTIGGGPNNLGYTADSRVLSDYLTFTDSLVWHVHGAASRQGYAGNHSIDGLIARNQFNDRVFADHQSGSQIASSQGLRISRTNSVFKDLDIQGFSVGIDTAQFGDFQNVGKSMLIEDGKLVNYINIRARDIVTKDRDRVVISDVLFDKLPDHPLTAFAWFDDPNERFRNASSEWVGLTSSLTEYFIHNYNGAPDADYKLYREGQNPFYTYRLLDGDFTAQQLSDLREYAALGELSPCADAACSNADASRPEILADVFPVDDSTASINPTQTIDGEYYTSYRPDYPYFTVQYQFHDSNGDRHNVQRRIQVTPGLNTAVLQEQTTDGALVVEPITIHVDGQAPTANVTITDVTSNSAVVRVLADEPVVAYVNYGIGGGSTNQWASIYRPELGITLPNLSPGSEYRGSIRISDRSGNSVTQQVAFTTLPTEMPTLVIDNLTPNSVVEAPIEVSYHLSGDVTGVSYVSWRLGNLINNETSPDGQHQFGVVASGSYVLTATLIGTNGAAIPGGQVAIPITVTNTDVDRPLITEVVVGNLEQGSVSINWATDEPSTTRIMVGGTVIRDDRSLATAHSGTISNLQSGRPVFVNLQSTDSAGNIAERFIYFRAGGGQIALTPPAISALAVAANPTSAVVTWTTDRPTDTRIDLAGHPTAWSVVRSTGLSVSHRVEVFGLVPNTSHSVIVTSAGATGLASEQTTFLTPEAPNFVGLMELVAISNAGGDLRANTVTLLRQRLAPAAADAAISDVVARETTPTVLRVLRARANRGTAAVPVFAVETSEAASSSSGESKALSTSRHRPRN